MFNTPLVSPSLGRTVVGIASSLDEMEGISLIPLAVIASSPPISLSMMPLGATFSLDSTIDFVNRATGSVDEAFKFGAIDSRFKVTWPAMYCLENAMYSSGECHVLIISNLENVKVCPARVALEFRIHCLESCDMGMVPPGERNYFLLAWVRAIL
jgi:hypothetical protein